MTEGPEPGRPDEELSQGSRPDEQPSQGGYQPTADAAPGHAAPPYAAAPSSHGAAPPHGAQPPYYAAPPYGPPPYGAAPPYGPPPPYGAQPPYPPPYGGYGGYGRPAAPKPGLVPLRPLSVGEILDGAFSAIRWNPKTILSSSAAVGAVSGVVLALTGYVMLRSIATDLGPTGPATSFSMAQFGNLLGAYVVLAAVTTTVTFLANTVLTGLLTVAVGQGVLGRKETLGSAWRATRPRIWALFGTVLLAVLFVAGGLAIAIAVSVSAGLLLGIAAHLPAVGVIVGVAGGLTAMVFAVITMVRWLLAVPVVMLERARPLASLRRSWRLVRRSSWRVFGIVLLTELIVGIANSIIKVPFQLAGGGITASTTADASIAGTLVSAVGDIIAFTVTAPMVAGVIVLLYADLRMRREGMDITLQAAAAPAGESAAGQNPGPW